MDENIPTPSVEEIDAVFYCCVKGGIELSKTRLNMFYNEGRSFAQTQESVRWQMSLRDLEVFKAASILWSISNMDSFVLAGRDPEGNVDDFLKF